MQHSFILFSIYEIPPTLSLTVRSLKSECHKEYVASFYEEDTPRLASLNTFFSEKLKYMVTGGEKLLVWHLMNPGSSR